MKISKEKYLSRIKSQKKSFKFSSSNLGITLIALVITIIILLILAGVTISLTVGQNGILKHATDAVEENAKASAREKLEIALADGHMRKLTQGLSEDELDNIIENIGGELLPKDDPDSNNQQVIVDGYIFEIDRSVPKIIDYVGPADGIVITAVVSGNGGWLAEESSVTVTGTIKTYSGGSIINVTATSNDIPLSGLPTNGGNYTINNITEDTTIVISATDSNGKTNTKTVEIQIKKDTIPPVVDTVTANAEGLKIKFSATGHDNESGLKQFNYAITSTEDTLLEGIPSDKRTGTFILGQTVEIETTQTGNRDETTYIIKVTATDNCLNTTLDINSKEETVTAIDGLTIAQLKELINADTFKKYLGTRVTDYNPEAGGSWRVFYYDKENYFGDGFGSIYLLMDPSSIGRSQKVESGTDSQEYNNARKFFPMYFSTEINYVDKYRCIVACEGWCNKDNWIKYCGEDAKYAIGCVPMEMFIKSIRDFSGSSSWEMSVTSDGFYNVGERKIASSWIDLPSSYVQAMKFSNCNLELGCIGCGVAYDYFGCYCVYNGKVNGYYGTCGHAGSVIACLQ